MNCSTKYVLLAIGVLILGYVIYVCCVGKGKNKETFAVDGAINGDVPIGGNYYNTYEMVEPTMDTFADIVAPSEPYAQQSSTCTNLPLATKAGMHTDYRDLLPDVNTHTTSYDIDVTDPEVFMWRPSVRATIHNRQHETADPLRGDLPIVKGACGYSNNSWFSSRYGVGDAKLDGYFSDFSNAKFRSLVGQKSYPQAIANEGTILDHNPQSPSGCGSELTLDWY